MPSPTGVSVDRRVEGGGGGGRLGGGGVSSSGPWCGVVAGGAVGAPLSPLRAPPRADRIVFPKNYNNNKHDREEKQMKTITLIIEGMMCQNCRSHVDKALNGISGVAANVSLEEKKAVCTVEDGVSADTLKAAVEDAGYTVISVE